MHNPHRFAYGSGLHADVSAPENNRTIGQGKERIVLAHTHIGAGEEFGPALPDENRAGHNLLAAERLNASILGIAVSPIARRALSFLMCHSQVPLRLREKSNGSTLYDNFSRLYRIVQRILGFAGQNGFLPDFCHIYRLLRRAVREFCDFIFVPEIALAAFSIVHAVRMPSVHMDRSESAEPGVSRS